MIVDDCEEDRARYVRYLKSEQYKFIVADTIDEARVLFETHKPDCLILDYFLPDGTAGEFLEAVSHLAHAIFCPIIMMTGEGDEKTAVEVLKKGAKDYLIKNEITRDSIKSAVTNNLQNAIIEQKLYEKNQQQKAETERKMQAQNREINFMATHDVLTSLINRKQFQDIIEREITISSPPDRKFAVLYVDLDQFTTINDELGHNVGDFVLVEVAKRLNAIVCKEDIVARLGSDEFALLITEFSDRDYLSQLAETILASLSMPMKYVDKEIRINLSIGISLFPDFSTNFEGLMYCSNLAMSFAKKLGKNIYQFYTEELSKEMKRKQHLEKAVQESVAQMGFDIVFHPQFDIQTNKMVGIEALLRLNHKEYGNISPELFIPMAEELGLIQSLGKWVLQESCKQYMDLLQHSSLKLAINISPRQLDDDTLISFIKKQINSNVLSPQDLELEITEMALLNTNQNIINQLNQLREMGIKIALDDFGTGYSSLAYLNTLPADVLKIDKSFITNLNSSREANIIVKSILNLAENFGMETIAEGVETKSQLEFLKSNRCSQVQGFYFAKPMHIKNISNLLH